MDEERKSAPDTVALARHRLELHDELDRLAARHLRRTPGTILGGLFALTLFPLIEDPSLLWAGVSVLMLSSFVGVTVAPLRRMVRMNELRGELTAMDRVESTGGVHAADH